MDCAASWWLSTSWPCGSKYAALRTKPLSSVRACRAPRGRIFPPWRRSFSGRSHRLAPSQSHNYAALCLQNNGHHSHFHFRIALKCRRFQMCTFCSQPLRVSAIASGHYTVYYCCTSCLLLAADELLLDGYIHRVEPIEAPDTSPTVAS